MSLGCASPDQPNVKRAVRYLEAAGLPQGQETTAATADGRSNPFLTSLQPVDVGRGDAVLTSEFRNRNALFALGLQHFSEGNQFFA